MVLVTFRKKCFVKKRRYDNMTNMTREKAKELLGKEATEERIKLFERLS